MKTEELKAFIEQDDRMHQIVQIGKDPWFLAYSIEKKADVENAAFYSALVADDQIAEEMTDWSWNIQMGQGRPGILTTFENGDEHNYYDRFGGLDGFEPLIHVREFRGSKSGSIEISEEFRLYFNLYFDKKANVFVRTDHLGNDEEIVRIAEDKIEIRLRELKEFAALKNAHIASFFDVFRYSPVPFSEIGVQECENEVAQEGMIFRFAIRHAPSLSLSHQRLSVLTGKKIIRGLTAEKLISRISEQPTPNPIRFIVGIDEDGEPVETTCEDPNDLRPIFFRREVLQKYYSSPDKYSVRDGLIACDGLWSSHIDNNHPKYVICHFCDLGSGIPVEELPYWRTFNVVPDGSFSEVHRLRAFHAVFTDPALADHVFKQEFQRFQSDFEKAFGWPLFKPLGEDDGHHFKTLRIPLTENQREFDEQVLSLAKLVIDSLNESGITSTGIEVESGKKGISKLEVFLRAKGLAGFESIIKFLRDLWDLRMGSGHRKGSEEKDTYRKAARSFSAHTMPLSESFSLILMRSTDALRLIHAGLLPQHEDADD